MSVHLGQNPSSHKWAELWGFKSLSPGSTRSGRTLLKTLVPSSVGWGSSTASLASPPGMTGTHVLKGPRAGPATWGSSAPLLVGSDWSLSLHPAVTHLAGSSWGRRGWWRQGWSLGLEGKPGTGLSPEGNGKRQKGLCCTAAWGATVWRGLRGAGRSQGGRAGPKPGGRRHRCARLGWDWPEGTEPPHWPLSLSQSTPPPGSLPALPPLVSGASSPPLPCLHQGEPSGLFH